MKIIHDEGEKFFRLIETILRRCDSDIPSLPPTQLYNEGWMLRLILEWFASLNFTHSIHPLGVPPNCRWYSEALIPSAFLAKSRGDSLAESWTHADAAIGDFDIGKAAKGDLSLQANSRHFVVLEAKMFSKLSAGVKNFPSFNQAARIVACIAEVLKRARKPPQQFSTLGFYVLAPSSQINREIFAKHLDKNDIRCVVNERWKYAGQPDDWFDEWFKPTLDCIDIRPLSWEDVINFLVDCDTDAIQLNTFYKLCLKFNGRPDKSQKRRVPG